MTETAYYLRVSTGKQDTDHQSEALRDYLGKDEFANASEYADIGSGLKSDRDEFQDLWSDVRAGTVERVVAYEISRISRKLSTSAEFIDDCVENEVALETVSDGFPDLRGDGSMMDKMVGQLFAWLTEYEGQMIRQRVQSGVDNAIDHGKWVGRPPFGFDTNSDGFLAVQPEDYVAMQTAIETAEENPRQSVNSIANACGVPQSTLARTLKDDEKRSLYVHGTSYDDRISEALDEAEIC